MNTTDKAPEAPAAAVPVARFEVLGTVADLYMKGIERLAGLQKLGLDLALQQNADVVAVWKKQVNGSADRSSPFLFEQFGTLFERYVETQKSAIDMVVEQSHAFAGGVKERNANAIKAGEEGVTLGEEAIEQSFAAQKTVLDYSAQQTKVAFDTAKKQFGYAETPAEVAADSVQRGVEIAIEAQKDILDALKAPMQTLH